MASPNPMMATMTAMCGDGKYIIVHRATIRFLDDREAAILWEALLGWWPQWDYGPIKRSDASWHDELEMTRRELDRAKAILVARGLCTLEVVSNKATPSPTTVYTINQDEFARQWAEFAPKYAAEVAAKRARARREEPPPVEPERTPPASTVIAAEPPPVPEPDRLVQMSKSTCTNARIDSRICTTNNTTTLNSLPNGNELPESPPGEQKRVGRKPPPTGEKPARQQSPASALTYEVATAIAEVCELDFSVRINSGRCFAAAKQIIASKTLPATAALVREKFSPGKWWNTESRDFRAGKPNAPQRPSPQIVAEKWAGWIMQQQAAAPVPQTAMTGEDDAELAELRRMRQVQGQAVLGPSGGRGVPGRAVPGMQPTGSFAPAAR